MYVWRARGRVLASVASAERGQEQHRPPLLLPLSPTLAASTVLSKPFENAMAASLYRLRPNNALPFREYAFGHAGWR